MDCERIPGENRGLEREFWVVPVELRSPAEEYYSRTDWTECHESLKRQASIGVFQAKDHLVEDEFEQKSWELGFSSRFREALFPGGFRTPDGARLEYFVRRFLDGAVGG